MIRIAAITLASDSAITIARFRPSKPESLLSQFWVTLGSVCTNHFWVTLKVACHSTSTEPPEYCGKETARAMRAIGWKTLESEPPRLPLPQKHPKLRPWSEFSLPTMVWVSPFPNKYRVWGGLSFGPSFSRTMVWVSSREGRNTGIGVDAWALIETVPFNRTLGAQKASSKYCQIRPGLSLWSAWFELMIYLV